MGSEDTITLAEFQTLGGFSDYSMMALLRAASLPVQLTPTGELRIDCAALSLPTITATLLSLETLPREDEQAVALEIEKRIVTQFDQLLDDLKRTHVAYR